MNQRTFTVAEDGKHARLDVFLVSLLPEQSRSQIQRLIKEGRVLLQGRAVKANQLVKSGQLVSIAGIDF